LKNRILTSFQKLQSKVETGLSYSSAVLLAVLMSLTSADVLLRYLFNSPIQGAYELTGFLLLGTICLGFACVQGKRGHIALTFLVDKLPPRVQLVLDIVALFIGLLLFGAMTYRGGSAAWESLKIKEFSPGLVEFPVYPARFALALGAGIMSIRLVLDIFSQIVRFLETGSSK
jgi:TRAP-type C4-dicarboxylate transport system permease small subunit